MNTFANVVDVHSERHYGYTHNKHFMGSTVFKIDPLVQIVIEPAKGAQMHPISAERIADGRGFRFPNDNVAMNLQPSSP